jgi:hypothetical protein
MSFASDLMSRMSTASDAVKPQQGNGAKHRCSLQENPPLYYSPESPLIRCALAKATSSAVPVMSQSEHQTPAIARLPACSATLSVIYNPKHSSAPFASVNTDQSMPGSVSQPVAQNAMHRPAKLACVSYRPQLASTHNTLTLFHSPTHAKIRMPTFPCCLSHEISSPNAGEVALSGGV